MSGSIAFSSPTPGVLPGSRRSMPETLRLTLNDAPERERLELHRQFFQRRGVRFGSLSMRFVTYDRGGQRRLGAIFEGEVVDLPDAVGHPAFPTTLEGLVSSSRGTVMDAARTALDRDDVFDWRVKRPRVLTPLFPASLLSPGSLDVERRVIGPEQEVPWPDGAAWLEYEPKVAAVLGLETSASEPFDPARHLFGFTLVNDWQARDSSGAPVVHADGLPIAIGHGTNDPVIGVEWGRRARALLEGAGADVRYRESPMAHSIDPEYLSELAGWLEDVLADR